MDAGPGIFVGRRRESSELQAALETARSGETKFVLLTGDAGIGKTRLAEELARAARQSGFDVLWGSCREEAGQPAYWPWVQVLRAHFGTRAAGTTLPVGRGALYIADLVPEVRAQLGGAVTADLSESEDLRFYLFDAVTRSLLHAATAAPLMIVLDDLHAADLPSLLLLQFAVRELRTARILLIGTYRQIEANLEAERGSVITQLSRQARNIPLGGLGEDDIAAFIEKSFGVRADHGLVTTVHKVTEGNAFFVDEVVRLLWSEGRLSGEQGPRFENILPQGVRAMIRGRLSPLAPDCRHVLAVAAVQGRQFDIGLLEAASEMQREQVLLAVAQARAAGIVAEVPNLLGRYAFVHGLIRDTIYEDLAEAQRIRLHKQMARALERLRGANIDTALAEIAYHHSRAAIGGDVAEAVDYSQRAGQRAASLLAYEDAVHHYEQALQALELDPATDERMRCELLVALGEARSHAGDRERARPTCIEAAALARHLGLAEAAARAALSLGGPWVEIGSVDLELVALLESALAGLGEQDSLLRVQLMARLSRELYWSENPERGVELAQAALGIAQRVGDKRALTAALTARVYSLWRPDKLAERIELEGDLIRLAQQVGDKEMQLRGHLWRMTDFLEQGDVEGVDREMAAYARLAEEVRQPSYLWYAPRNQAMRALLSGQFAEAETLGQEAFAIGTRAHRGIAAQALGVLTLLLRWERGETDDLADIVKNLRQQYPILAAWQCGLAFLYAEQGREQEARREFELVAGHGFGRLPRDANWLLALALLSLACADLEDADRAAQLYELLLPYRRRNVIMGRALVYFGCTSHYLGALARTLQGWKEAEEHYEDALRMHREIGARPWVARTQARYARLLQERNQGDDREHAAALFDDALETATALGMQRLAQRTAERRRALPAAPGAPGGTESRAAGPASHAVFRRDGDYWSIGFAGDLFRLKDSKGLEYIAQLLRYPNRHFHVMELASLVSGPSRTRTVNALGEPNVHISRLDDAPELLDAAARASYEDRFRHLCAEIEEASEFNDLERAGRARDELELLTDQFSAAAGFGGRGRRAASAAERARVNVTKQIKAAIGRIEQHAPALAADLKRSIRTGRVCSYTPDPRTPIEWEI